MMTGNDEFEIAFNAMKSWCSDFLVKDVLSHEAVRRAAINALQKTTLSRGLETHKVMRKGVEAVLDKFTKECAEEIQPVLFKMMRHVRNLHAVTPFWVRSCQ